MRLDEKNENIMMLNEELEWYIRELNKVKNSLHITKIELNNLENVILNTIKEKDKDNNTKENDKEFDESMMQNQSNANYNNYSLDNDKNKSNSDIPMLNLSLITKLQNSPK